MKYTEEEYRQTIQNLLNKIQSFQSSGISAYKPGMEDMFFMDDLLGHPHRKFMTIHIAGTDGKGSVSNMLASYLAACGLKTGLYTSPHLLDFRERMRILDGSDHKGIRMIGKDQVMEFVQTWHDTFDHLGMSFFEITTSMAFDWFAKEKVDVAVIETGLGGRLDSTNIITPALSVITSIGLDHCDILGNTLGEIAFEKAGIIKEGVPVVIGETDDRTRPIFERKVMYTNMSGAGDLIQNREKALSLLTFADDSCPILWDDHKEILGAMDLQGSYQKKNLRTVLTAISILLDGKKKKTSPVMEKLSDDRKTITEALIHTAERMDFHGRWEKLSEKPYILCDIGHNEHGLRYNFAQLEEMMSGKRFSGLTIIFGCVSDKDIDAVMALMPENADYIFTQAQGKRAMPAEKVKEKYINSCNKKGVRPSVAGCTPTVAEAMSLALASSDEDRLIYIGGSTYVVSEALSSLQKLA